MKRYLIIGNGVAGSTAAENIRKLDKTGSITIVTDEGLPFYYRIRLNEFIAGEIAEQALIAKKDSWYRENQIDLKLKTRIKGAKQQEKVLLSETGQGFAYDSLLIASGSRSFIPPIKGSDQRGVFALRNIQDAHAISAYASDIKEVVLIGGGLLGLEAGNALRRIGKKVIVVEFFPRLLPRQLDADGAKRLQDIMEGMGFAFRLGAKTQEIRGDGEVNGVLLEGGEVLPAGMVIVSAGVRPNLELAQPLGLATDKGVKVDEYLRTNQPDVYAAGDVAEFRGMPYGIWPAAMEQGKIAGNNMAGGEMTYAGTTMSNTLKVVGVDLAAAGDIDGEGKYESRVVAVNRVYKKIVLRDNQIIGCIMLGDTKGFDKITRAISQKRDVAQLKDQILAEGFDFKRL